MYRTPGQHWLDLASRVRFAGETLRPWPVTLLYALGASDSGRVLLQFGGGHRMLDVLRIYQVGAVSRQRTWALVSGGAAATLTLTGGVSSWGRGHPQ